MTADVGIQFALAKIDPRGRATNGNSTQVYQHPEFQLRRPRQEHILGGDDAWDSDSYLNIWACNTVGGLLGYSSLPGGPKAQDGVVISTSVFGTINVSGSLQPGQDRGARSRPLAQPAPYLG